MATAKWFDILAAVLTNGLPAVEAACAEALAEAVYSADVILNIQARRRDPGAPITILTPPALPPSSRRIPCMGSPHDPSKIVR